MGHFLRQDSGSRIRLNVTGNRNGQNLAWVMEITYHAWGRECERTNTVFVNADDGTILIANPMDGEIWPESRINNL